eukprot:scaffold666979_cov55-Attheya_sp.AAC.4
MLFRLTLDDEQLEIVVELEWNCGDVKWVINRRNHQDSWEQYPEYLYPCEYLYPSTETQGKIEDF